MQPSQITPLSEAASHLMDAREAQKRALDAALALVDRLPLVAFDYMINRSGASFRARWGVQVLIHPAAVEAFPALAEEFNAVQRTDVQATGGGRVSLRELLVGEFAGVPFEIRAYLGSQAVAA